MGLPSLQALGWGGGGTLLLSNIFQGRGGWGTTFGGVLNSGVWQGVLFFVSQVHFFSIFMLLD